MEEAEELTVKILQRRRLLVSVHLYCNNEVLEILERQIVDLHNNIVATGDAYLNDGRVLLRATYTTFPNQALAEQLSLERIFGQRGFRVSCYRGPPSSPRVYCHKCYKTRRRLCINHGPDDYYYSIEWSY